MNSGLNNKKTSSCKRPIELFPHLAIIYANLLEQKKAFAREEKSTPTGLVWNTNMATVSLFWGTNMAAVTSCENTLLVLVYVRLCKQTFSLMFLMDMFYLYAGVYLVY